MCPAPIPMPLPRTNMKNSCQKNENLRACNAGPALRPCGTSGLRRASAPFTGEFAWAQSQTRTLAGKAARLESEPCATFGSLWCTAAGTVAPTRNDTLVTHYPVSVIGRTEIKDEEAWAERRRQGPNGVCPTPFVTHYPISVIGRIEAIHEGESRRGLLGQSPRDRPPAGALAPTRIDTLVTRSAVSVIGKTKIRNEDKSGRAPLGPTPGVPTRTQRHGRDGHATGNVAQGPLSGPAARLDCEGPLRLTGKFR